MNWEILQKVVVTLLTDFHKFSKEILFGNWGDTENSPESSPENSGNPGGFFDINAWLQSEKLCFY